MSQRLSGEKQDGTAFGIPIIAFSTRRLMMTGSHLSLIKDKVSKMAELKVAYACNDGYIMQTGISLISLFENNRHFDAITLYMISCGISKEKLSVIESICKQYGPHCY